jgi:uncharacterized membrane protein
MVPRWIGARRLAGLRAVALLGVLETGVLSAWLALGAGCTRAGPCALLRGIPEGEFLGLPLPVLGFAAYSTVAWLALEERGPRRGSLRSWFLVCVSLGMTIVSLFLVQRMVGAEVACPWCLVSALLSTVLGLLAFPWDESAVARVRALGGGLVLGLVVSAALAHRPARAELSEVEQSKLVALANELRISGARLHGAWWCLDCRRQRELFGPRGESLLPYVEVGTGEDPPELETLPTWEIDGCLYPGVRAPEDLAKLLGIAEVAREKRQATAGWQPPAPCARE